MVNDSQSNKERTEKINVENLCAFFSEHKVINNISVSVYDKEILGIIGPSNSGKSTFLRCINRLNELSHIFSMTGSVKIDSADIYKDSDACELRKSVGMVFALPMALPMSIFDNIAYGPRRHGLKDNRQLEEIVERTLKAAFLWDEVKDRLDSFGMKLSGGQQQRLALARTLAVDPDIILYDEPCSGLDPISTAKIEEAMSEFKEKYTQILVTNNTKQAARVSDRTAFFLMGDLIEIDRTEKIFTAPSNSRTNDYISGRFG
jgi:phosphate transport system ATP-binding protein